MKKVINFILIVSLSTFLLSCSHQKTKTTYLGSSPWFQTSTLAGKAVHRYYFENGLKLLVLEDHSAPTFAYQTWFNVGSMDEEPGLTGLAHLFEHMMFKATKTHPDGEFDKILETAGVEGENAFTNRDYTAYVQSMPVISGNKNLDLIASLESDRMVNLIVDDKALDKEREVVQNERRFRNENNPDGKLYERIYEATFKNHSYHWPVIGYEKDLLNAKSKQCMEFYKKYYAPNNATIIVVGDVDHSNVAKTIEKYYGTLIASKINRRAIVKDEAVQSEKTETLTMKTEVEKLVLAYRAVDGSHKDFAALELIRNIISVGKSSRLYKKLIDSGIASDVEIDNSEHKDPGLFIFFVNLQKGKTAKQALDVIDKTINELITSKVTSAELSRSIAMLRFSVFDDLSSNESKARFMGHYETVTGNFVKGIEMIDAIKNFKPEELQTIAKNYFDKNRRVVLFGVSENKVAKQ